MKDFELCGRCYGDVRGECIRCGFCIMSPPHLFSRAQMELIQSAILWLALFGGLAFWIWLTLR